MLSTQSALSKFCSNWPCTKHGIQKRYIYEDEQARIAPSSRPESSEPTEPCVSAAVKDSTTVTGKSARKWRSGLELNKVH